MNRRIFHTKRYSTSGAFRTESLALFSAMSVQLSDSQKILVNTEIDRLITNGSWAQADAIWFPMLVTEQQSLLNWKNPGVYTLIPMNFASSFVTKTGFPAVSANSTYLRTQYTPFTNGIAWQPSDAKIIAYVKDDIQDDGRTIGGIANGNTMMRPRDTSNQFIGRINDGSATVANSVGNGLFSVSTANGTTLVHKRNNVSLGSTAVTTNGSRTNSELYVYAWNDGSGVGTPNYFINNNTIQCIAFGSSSMDDAVFKTVRDNLASGL